MNKIFIRMIKKYQVNWSPKLSSRGVQCIYHPTCSEYAIKQFQRRNTLFAIALSILRLLSCNPINAYIKINKICS